MIIALEKPKNEAFVLLPRTLLGNSVKVSIQSLRMQLKNFRDEQAVQVSLDEVSGMKRITLKIFDYNGIEEITDIRKLCLRSNVTVSTTIRELFQLERWLNIHGKQEIKIDFDGNNLRFYLKKSVNNKYVAITKGM